MCKYFISIIYLIMKTLQNLLKIITISLFLNIPAIVFAGWIDHFEVLINPETAKIGETLDITIIAVDKDTNTVTDYEWSILVFSESDPEADFPNELKENSYTFSVADEWEIKFENAVVFNNSWIQDIHVYDLNDDNVMWIAEVDISKDVVETNVEVSILSPESGLTIWEKRVTVSWTSRKNHKISILVNWSTEITTNTNSSWVFEKEITELDDWENSIKARVLNSDDIVIWESEVVNIKIDSTKPKLKSIKLTPSTDIEAESEIDVELISNAGLTSVNIIVGDILTELTDQEWNWIYTWKLVAPKEAWDYSVDTILKDELWHEITELWVESISVKEIELKVASDPDPITEEAVELTTEETKDLTITWLKVVELKTKSVLSWDKIEWVDSYSIYQKMEDDTLELIDMTTENKFEIAITWDEVRNDYFLVKATAETSTWILYEWDLSKAVKVKTGPEVLILFLISLLVGWAMFLSKRRA